MTEDKKLDIIYKSDGPNLFGKYSGYVSINERPSLYTRYDYSTPEVAIAAIQELLKRVKV